MIEDYLTDDEIIEADLEFTSTSKEAVWTKLKAYAKTDIQSGCLSHIIDQAIYVKEDIESHPLPNRPDRIVNTAQNHINDAISALCDLDIDEGYRAKNSDLLQTLLKYKVEKLDTVNDIINSAIKNFTEELLSCEFSDTCVSKNIIPTIKKLIKGTL